MRCMYCMEEYDEDLDVICPYCGNDVVDIVNDSTCLQAGTVLKHRYVLGRVLGDGGFGITYMGFDKALKRKVAVKEFFPNECVTRQKGESEVTPLSGERGERYANGLKSFQEEAQRLANLGSVDGVVNVFDVFAANGTAYIVMEYLSGDTVAQMVEKSHMLGFGKTMNIIVPVLRSLIKIHKAGIIHRDVSPQNIIRTGEGKIVLIDFGAARSNAFSISKSSMSVVLKQGYSPIEQYDNKLKQDTYTDVYAVAATMYYMLTGITPDFANSRLLDDKLPPVSQLRDDLPEQLDSIIANALAVRPEDRTQTAQELLDQIMTLKDFKRDPNKKKPKRPDKAVTQTVSKQQWKSYVEKTPVTTYDPAEREYKPKVITISHSVNNSTTSNQVKSRTVSQPVPEEEEPKKVSAPLIVGILVALVVLGGLLTVGYLDKRDNMTVPDFVGQNIDGILSNSEYEFDFEIVNIYNPDTDLDVVISQSPVSSSRHVKKDSHVRLTVNSLDTEVTIPVMTKMSQTVAQSTLESLFLEGEFVVIHDDNFDEGTVIRTEPVNGTKVNVKSKVTVYIAENSVTVPTVVGKTYEEAAELIEKAGLHVGEITYDYSDEYDTGCIISQGVDSSVKVEKGTYISLVVSQGRPYEVTLSESVELSTLKAPFKIVVYADGEEESSKMFYSTVFKNTYDFDIVRYNTRGEVTVEVYVDGELFRSYIFDFKNSSITLMEEYEVSAQKRKDTDSDTSSKTTSSKTTSSETTSSETDLKPDDTTHSEVHDESSKTADTTSETVSELFPLPTIN